MIEIQFKERKKIEEFYETIKNLITSKKDNDNYHYYFKQYRLYEEVEYPGISKNYYNEEGSVIFENNKGDSIKLYICRWHAHQHNGCSGLNGIPCLKARISVSESEKEEKTIWELKVESGTLHYKAYVSSLDFPNDILKEKEFEPIDPPTSIIIEQQNSDVINVESQQPIDIDSEFNELFNNYMCAKKNKEKLLAQRDKELEEAVKNINKIYLKKIKQNDEEIDSATKKINEFEKLLSIYSTFDIDLLGNILQVLISFMENEEYLYKLVTHNFKKRVYGTMDNWDENIKTKAAIIVRQDKYLNSYDSNNQSQSEIDKLVQNGYAIVLSEQNFYSKDEKKIIIYSFKDWNKICNIDVNKFSYVKEFLDFVIHYRFQNNIFEITEKNMLFLLNNFIMNHKNIIINNYEEKLKEKILTLQL